MKNIQLSRKGATRTTLLIGDYAFKFPTLTSHLHFLEGCRGNWQERSFYSLWGRYGVDNRDKYCPSYFCSLFGLVQIQRRLPELGRDLTEEEKEEFKAVTGDFKKENFGIFNNKVVCLDYA